MMSLIRFGKFLVIVAVPFYVTSCFSLAVSRIISLSVVCDVSKCESLWQIRVGVR